MITVRKANLADARAIADAESRYIDCPWTQAQIESEIESSAAVFLVAETGGEFCGYLSGVIAADECEISNIAVEERYRRRGAATALFDTLIGEIVGRGVKYVFLTVRSGNGAAVSLYEKLGFARVGLRRGYYRNGDAVIMRLNI